MLSYLPLLFILACPLMMIFMMRGMNSGHGMSAKDKDLRHDAQPAEVDAGADQRIRDLESQVAALRAEPGRTENVPSQR